MSAPELRNRADEDWTKKETVGRFIRDIVIVAIVLAAGFGFYWKRTQDATAANKLAKEAKDLILLDNPKDFLAAEAKLKEVLEKYDSSHGYTLSALAEINAILWTEHKVAERKADAEKYTAMAMDEDPHLAEQYSARALVELAQGKHAAVAGWIEKDLIEKQAGAARVFNAFAKANRALGKLDLARRSFKGAQDSDWRNPRFAADLAESYLEDGDTFNAIGSYGKGLNANPDHLLSKIGKARAQIIRGENFKEVSDALTDILGRPATELTPNLRARALAARAELRLAEGDMTQAIADADAAVGEDPAFAPAYRAKGLALARNGDGAGAAAAFDKAIGTDANVALFYYDASASMIDLDPAKALSYLEKYPLTKDDRYFVRFGDALRRLGRVDEAMAKYEKALEDNQLNAQAHLAVGSILLDKGEIDKAAEKFEMATGAQEFFPEAYMEKGRLRFAKKEYADGAAEYAQALQQLRQMKAPRERLTAIVEMVKQDMIKAKEKEMAKMWETEASALIR